jgi:hypothetical protein
VTTIRCHEQSPDERSRPTEYCYVAQAYANGIVDAHFTIKFTTGALRGTVTGGTGGYNNATGTLSGTPADAGEAVTVTYKT